MSFPARTLLLFLVITGCAMACLGQQSGAAQRPPSRVATPPGAGQRHVGPKEFSSQRGRFKIFFPGTPTEKDTSINIIFVGRVDSREYKFAEHPTYYGVIYDDFAGDLEKDAERRNYAMNRMRDAGLSSGPNRRVLSESEVWLGRYPGRALKISIPDGVRRSFEELDPIKIDVDGDGRPDTIQPRVYALVTRCAEGKPLKLREIQHWIKFDLVTSGGRRIPSFFKYQYGTGEADYWVYALFAAGDVNGDGKTDLVFYSGDDTSDERVTLVSRGHRFVVHSRKQTSGDY